LEILLIALAVLVVVVIAGFVVVGRRRGGAPAVGERAPRPPFPVPAPSAVEGLRSRLSKTRRALGGAVGSLLRRGDFDADLWSDLEDTLVAADVGVAAATTVVEKVRAANPSDPDAARIALERELIELFAGKDRMLRRDSKPSVILVVGVNGSGKTTSIAKIAAQMQRAGSGVLLGAADTFRAAADQQLRTWASRVGVDIVTGKQGADPASVAYETYQKARAEGIDVALIDTAGRLQTKANLMDELAKVARVLEREAGAIDEVLLVLDGTTGQNGIAQAKGFSDAVDVTGIVLTKLDGTAKGGVAVAVEQELGIPVKYIGVGEGVDDLVPFHPEDFVDALLGA
jgi:fused signal recognition particle receptor